MRRSILIASLLLFSLAAERAHGQTAIYVTSSSDRFSNVPNTSDFWTSGVGAGVTLNFIPVGPVNLGFDFRGSSHPGTNGADTGFGGIRLGVHAPIMHVKPYIQASGGYVGTRSVNAFNGADVSNHYATWEVVGGIDVPLTHFIDLRAIEFGGGTGYNTSNAPNLSLLTFNSGLVVHF
jgi:hypothetical protein